MPSNLSHRAYRPAALGVLVALVVLSGCRGPSPREAATPVRQNVLERTGHELTWSFDDADRTKAEELTREALREPLTASEAVRVALLNNPDVQVTLEELGVAKGALVEAAQIRNPVLAGHVRFADGGAGTNSEFSIVAQVLDVLFVPMRKKLAAAQLRQAQARVAHEVLNLAAEVQSAYFEVHAAERIAALNGTIAEAADAAADLADQQLKVGSTTELAAAHRRADALQARLELSHAKLAVTAARERLARLMGVSGDWTLATPPALPPDDAGAANLEEAALERRLDLAAAREEAGLAERALSLGRKGLLTDVELGVSTEREIDGTHVTGPEFRVELPIFNQRQGQIAQLEATARQARWRLAAREADVRSQVRLAHARVLAAREAAEAYDRDMVPQRRRVLELSQQQFNAMSLGVFDLLEARRAVDETLLAQAETLRDYWLARIELSRVTGGKLPNAGATAPESGLPASAPRNEDTGGQATRGTPETLPAPESHDHHHHH